MSALFAGSAFEVHEVSSQEDITLVRALVVAHGDARRTTPGVEYVYADAANMPGPYVPPNGGIWIALAGNVGAGCVALRDMGSQVGEIKRMFVAAGFRGQGVGRALLVALIAGARARGYQTLRLGTLDDMLAARQLYASVGFIPIERYRHDELIDTRFHELALTSAVDKVRLS